MNSSPSLSQKRNFDFKLTMPHGTPISKSDIPVIPSNNIESNENIEVLGELGRGATSIVYLIYDKQKKTKYALKTIKFPNSSNIQQVINEINSLRMLRNQNIVMLYDTSYKNGHINLKMAYIDGSSLDQMIKLSPQIPEPVLGRIAYLVSNGLQYLYEKRFIHRDLKPSNILISSKGDVKIADFGMAKQLSQSVEEAQSYLGSISYMAPERILCQPYNFKADVWSYGVSLYQCVLGRIPFTSTNQSQNNIVDNYWCLVDEFQQNDSPISISDNYSESFQNFLKLCLEKDPDKRPDIKSLRNHPWLQSYSSQQADPPFLNWIQETLAKTNNK